MKASTRQLRGALTAAIVLSAVLAAAAASSTNVPARNTKAFESRTLHLVERGGGLRVVDNPPRARHQYDFSGGDIVIVTRSLFTASGLRVGSLRLACVATDSTTQQCSGTETLTAGSLELAGTSTPEPSTTVAVIGGTGAYAGARGTSVSRDRTNNANLADQTIALLP